MKTFKTARENSGLSQRRLAKLAKLSYKSLQLLEAGGHDPKISTLQNLAKALGYPPHSVEHCIASLFSQPVDSIAVVSERMAEEGEASWKLWLFNFVDAFRRARDPKYIETSPSGKLSPKILALLASTVESLCAEMGMQSPRWCEAVATLEAPWFVAGVENLKAMALVESPVFFRKRNIFVLVNFLERR